MGVYQFTGASSALAVCMVLNVRKLVSLLLSVLFFGSEVGSGFVLGVGLVFVGVVGYAMDGMARVKERGGG